FGCSSTASATVQIFVAGEKSFTDPVTGVSISFTQIEPGSTITITSPATNPGPAPTGYYEFTGLDGETVSFEISATGDYSAPITITFPVPWRERDFAGFKAIKILHGEIVDGVLQLIDVTHRHTYDRQNPELSTITARVSSLSPFLLSVVRRPTVDFIEAPVDPVVAGASISATAFFTDPDGATDVHTAIWNWGDGTTSTGAVIEPGIVGEPDEYGEVAGSHTYDTPGVYTVSVTVSDGTDIGGSDTARFQYVVVYDPNGGFVTGGGWIDSPAGAYANDVSLSGKATFGFVSKYQKGAQVPTGQTQFNFEVGAFSFRSTAYEWLVVSGPKAQYKGVGQVNGNGDFGFLLTATDGHLPGGGGADKFRIKIWDRISGEIIYDNVGGAGDDLETADPQPISGGSIVIHSAS
ncbi:MAG TPA: PKD domain-containing protein, partial [Rhodothermales bacterium]|nr:PKD domain-containing protein [Rhodothermales bacterium]